MGPEELTRSVRRTVASGDLRRWHALPMPGRILVEEGDHVAMGQVWSRGRMRAGVTVVDLPRLLNTHPSEVHKQLAVSLVETVEEGDVLAGSPGRLGTGRQWLAPARGMLTSVSQRTGVAVFVRDVREVALHCLLAGIVVNVSAGDGVVIEGRGVAVAAALGAGGRAIGRLRFVGAGDSPDAAVEAGDILITPDPLQVGWMRRVLEVHPAAVVAPSADDETLTQLALAPTIAGMPLPQLGMVPVSVPTILTEGVGYGRMPRALQAVLRGSAGETVAVVGSRQPGASEIILPPGRSVDVVTELRAGGLPVRIMAGPDAWDEGVVIGPAPGVGRAASGSPATCVQVRRAEGGVVAVPVSDLEAIA